MRVRLDSGRRVDLNAVIRAGKVDPTEPGGLALWDGNSRQIVSITSRPRHLGGCQWYFVCPVTGRLASVLYKPPGARQWASRHAWRGRVAYSSQFERPHDRAYRAQAKIRARLIGNLDPDDWDLPPKPKWMRWRTYNRHVERFETCEAVIHCEMASIAGRWLARYS